MPRVNNCRCLLGIQLTQNNVKVSRISVDLDGFLLDQQRGALGDEIVSIHAGLHAFLSMREHASSSKSISEAKLPHHFTCEPLKVHSSVSQAVHTVLTTARVLGRRVESTLRAACCNGELV